MTRGGRAGPTSSHRKRPTHLVIGRIAVPHGVKGEVEAEILTDFPDRFSLLKTVYLGEELEAYVLQGHRHKKGRLILKLAGCDDRNQAAMLRGRLIYVPIEEAMPLQEDEYYVYEIVGLEVWTAGGEFLGRVDDILFTGSNDVYVVRDGDEEMLIPAISSAVKEVDMDRGRLIVHLMEGLR